LRKLHVTISPFFPIWNDPEAPMFSLWEKRKRIPMIMVRHQAKGTSISIDYFTPNLVFNSLYDAERHIISMAETAYEDISDLAVLPFAIRRQAAYVASRSRRGFANAVMMNQRLYNLLTSVEDLLPIKPEEPTKLGYWTVGGSINKWGDSGLLVFISDVIADNEAVIMYSGHHVYGKPQMLDTVIGGIVEGHQVKIAVGAGQSWEEIFSMRYKEADDETRRFMDTPPEKTDNPYEIVVSRYMTRIKFHDESRFWTFSEDFLASGYDALQEHETNKVLKGYHLTAKLENVFLDKRMKELVLAWHEHGRSKKKCFDMVMRKERNGI
jgi:hypothetical protein